MTRDELSLRPPNEPIAASEVRRMLAIEDVHARWLRERRDYWSGQTMRGDLALAVLWIAFVIAVLV